MGQKSFECAFEAGNMAHCQPLIDQAAALGFALPTSVDDMSAQCAASALQASGAQNSSLGSACTTGLVGQIRAYGTSCIDSCQEMCHPLDLAIKAYLTKGGAPAAKPVVCHYQSAFKCALSGGNKGKCMPLINKAASFGFALPRSLGQLSGQCR